MRKINKLGRRAAAMALAISLTLSTAAPVLAADADEVQTPAAQTEQQETDTEADEADALPEQPDVGGFEPIEESEMKPVVDAQETDEAQQPGPVEPDVFPGPGSFEPIDESELKTDSVSLGVVVVLHDIEFDEDVEYYLVGSTEANPMENRISNESPVGSAIIGHKKGDVVDVQTPAGICQYKILEIKLPNK